MTSYNKSIGRTLFWLFSFLLIWAVFAGNFNNGDFIHYENEFENGSLDRLEELGGIEPLYSYLIIFLKSIYNFRDYVEYHAVISFIFMIPYWYTIRKWSTNSTVTILFFAPIFLLQAIIVRNFMAFAIMSLAIPLLANPKKKNLILFGLLLLIAEGFHNMMFVYLICYLSLSNLKIFKSPIMFFIVCVIVGLLAGGVLYTFMTTSTAKYNDIDDNGYNFLRMVFGVPLLLNYFILRYIKKNTKDSDDTEIAKFEDLILKLNLIFIALTALFAVSVVASRLFVNLLLFNMIFVTNRLMRKGKKGGAVPVSLVYVGWWIYYVLIITLSVQLEDLFKYNYFIIGLLSL